MKKQREVPCHPALKKPAALAVMAADMYRLGFGSFRRVRAAPEEYERAIGEICRELGI